MIGYEFDAIWKSVKTIASQLEKMIKNVLVVDEYIDYFQYYQILFSLLNNKDFWKTH